MNNVTCNQFDLFSNSFDATQVQTTEPPVSAGPTLVEYATKVQHRLWPKDHTRNSNMRAIRWFSEYSNFGKLTMADIRRKHIYEFVEHLMATRTIGKAERKFSQNTANRYMAAISSVMNDANHREVVDNPIKLKYPSENSGRPRYFTRAEEQELVEYLRSIGKDWMADMVTLSCNTGMRRGEILAINEPGVELSEDGEYLYLPWEVCKSNDGRDVPLNDQAKAAYDRLKPVIDAKFSHRTFYRAWNKAKRDVGKGDKNFVFHVCRHTAATRLANDAKTNEFVIADILGHASTRTTRRYVHSQRKTARDAVNAI